ncbi:MAG: tRNA 2-thiouridine(34) synthase MnmA [Clostridia bacterium]|nr:tRNA 2-thiouridine(34) synthase MnmA [Clostridia bacterium]
MGRTREAAANGTVQETGTEPHKKLRKGAYPVAETRPKALIAMSGGVDSTVSAYLMMRAGFDCVGVTMRLFDTTDIGTPTEKSCCSIENVDDARSVCDKLGIPFYPIWYRDEFRAMVMDKFVDDYEHGRTPNPCVECNRALKFDHLFQKARELGCSTLVTGHYARISYNETTGRFELKKAVYEDKDQSYVLYAMTQDQLAHIRFPLGDYTKPEVRAIAEEQGFVNAKRHESQDICFIPDGDYAAFIERYTGKTYPAGNYVDRDGNVLGQHRGIIHYTVGQRKGLGITFGEPRYVCDIRPEQNEVVLGKNEDLFRTELLADDVNFISVAGLDGTVQCTAKVRYKQPDKPATVIPLPDGTVKVVFEEPQRAITRGQAVVFYQGDTVLGGGTIVE